MPFGITHEPKSPFELWTPELQALIASRGDSIGGLPYRVPYASGDVIATRRNVVSLLEFGIIADAFPEQGEEKVWTKEMVEMREELLEKGLVHHYDGKEKTLVRIVCPTFYNTILTNNPCDAIERIEARWNTLTMDSGLRMEYSVKSVIKDKRTWEADTEADYPQTAMLIEEYSEQTADGEDINEFGMVKSDIAHNIPDFIRMLISTGRYDAQGILEEVFEWFDNHACDEAVDFVNFDTDIGPVDFVIAEEIRKHEALIESWAHETDCDRLFSAFDELKKRGYGILENKNYAWLGSKKEGTYDRIFRKSGSTRGIVSYSWHEIESCLLMEEFSFSVCANLPLPMDDMEKEITEVLKAHGFSEVRTTGSFWVVGEIEFTIPLKWENRRCSMKPPLP
jgi:hypothetical protein